LTGNIELRLAEPEAAAELFGKGVRLRPQAWQAHYGLGRAFTMKKQWPEAETELKRALEASPENVEVNYALARLYQQMGRRAEAEREFQICNRLNAQRQRTGSGIAGEHQ